MIASIRTIMLVFVNFKIKRIVHVNHTCD